MASDSGEIWHPYTSHYLVQVQVNSKKKASGKATKDLWICQKDQTLFSQIQDQGTRQQLPYQHKA